VTKAGTPALMRGDAVHIGTVRFVVVG